MEQLCQTKIAVIGAGPAGIYCTINLLKKLKENNIKNCFVDIFDKSQVLRTILPTGNGRCNITNSIPDIKEFSKNYPRGEKFLYSIFSKHFNYDVLDFFEEIGIKTYLQEDGRYFPKSNSSKEVKDKLLNYLKNFKNYKLINKNISDINEVNKYDYIVIACGSRSCENLLNSTKHKVIEFKKALCALKIKDFEKYPQGVSVKSLDGDFLFTKDGISGPLVFKISSINAYKKFPYNISIKLFNEENLFELIKKYPKKSIGNLVSSFIPKSLAKVLVEDYDKNACEISKEKIISYSKINFTTTGTTNAGEIVNAGGIDLDELDKNCHSKINEKLWFCGEVLNIDGFCGGFNLQNCWSSGFVVASDIFNKIILKGE